MFFTLYSHGSKYCGSWIKTNTYYFYLNYILQYVLEKKNIISFIINLLVSQAEPPYPASQIHESGAIQDPCLQSWEQIGTHLSPVAVSPYPLQHSSTGLCFCRT